MRSIRNLLWFVLGIFIAAAFMIPSAYAQTAHVDPAFNRILNGIVSNTPGVVTQSIPSGVSTVGTGTSTVTTASGLRIPIAETATANVSKSAIAKAGAGIFARLNAIGTAAWLAYKLQEFLAGDDVFVACPAPNFVCKQNPAQAPYTPGVWDLYGYSTPSATAAPTPVLACEKYGRSGSWSNPRYTYRATMNGTSAAYCFVDYDGNNINNGNYSFQVRLFPTSCNTGFALTNGKCVFTGTRTPGAPYTPAEMEQALKDRMDADAANSKKIFDAIREDAKRLRTLDGNYPLPPDTPLNFPPDTPIVLPPDSPLTIYAPPVTTPEKTVKTRTIPLSDGTVNTETTKEKTTVTPTTSGTTVADTKTTYPTTTTQTTTTTNNTTNITNTTTTIINESPQVEPPEPPKDPCEGNPNRAGCALLGEPPAAEEIPKQDIPVSVTAVPFASAASCPADLTFNAYGARNISYVPFCNKMTEVRPIFLALAALASAIIVMGFFRI